MLEIKGLKTHAPKISNFGPTSCMIRCDVKEEALSI
jgi:hypothetical protein